MSDDRDLTTALRDVADAHQTPPQVSGTEIRRRAARRRRRRHGAFAGTAVAAAGAAVVLAFTTGLGGGTEQRPATAASDTPSPRPAATVDLSRRLLTIAGRELAVSSGTARHPTPTGLMTVTAKFPTKTMDSAALGLGKGDGYEITLPWVVELRTADGRTNYVVALTWNEKAPGTSDVTQGWIGLRTADAKWLYAKLKPGMVLSVGRSVSLGR
ncbi:L,D-transpeptidase [Streptomyces sp. NPDC102270]|uniref:L,D-transpeptidase n=1 Tax=Streptomyces sp. NPDC102270 TaxID=3366150 RepID=UPI003816CEDE